MTTREQIAVMKAYDEGAEIEARENETEEWQFVSVPGWNWGEMEYRVKPDPPRMSNLHLAMWLATGHGQKKKEHDINILTYHTYSAGMDWEAVSDCILIRPWKTDRWIKPSLEIFERDCE